MKKQKAGAPARSEKRGWTILRFSSSILLLTAAVICSLYWITSAQRRAAEIGVQAQTKDSHFTYEQYERITIGMSYAEVADLFGCAGELDEDGAGEDSALALYIWKNRSGAVVQVSFMHDAVTSKTQYGLESAS
ncbi:MAG: hypothetical protein HFE78_01365 [Clostridiales bacterium]|nr:hypothetical protein [Clostridiales bacterium]